MSQLATVWSKGLMTWKNQNRTYQCVYISTKLNQHSMTASEEGPCNNHYVHVNESDFQNNNNKKKKLNKVYCKTSWSRLCTAWSRRRDALISGILVMIVYSVALNINGNFCCLKVRQAKLGFRLGCETYHNTNKNIS